MKNLTRRKILLGAAGGSVLGLGSWAWLSGRKPASPDDLIASVVDTIVPRDETPGALDLGLDLELIERLENNSKSRERVNNLLTVISEAAIQAHRRPFTRLSQLDRESVLMSILEGENTAPGYVDMHRLRTTIFTWYYRSREVQSSLGYTQPNRYPAYPGAPKRGRKWTLMS